MAHSIQTRYCYQEADYRSLIWAMRQKNSYRYGALIERPADDPGEPAHKYARGIHWYRVPEGWVVLGTHREKRWAFLQDLRDSPLHLTPFVLTWTAQRSPAQERRLTREQRALPSPGRLTLSMSGKYVKSKLAIIGQMATRHARIGTETARTPLEFVTAVNAVTQEVSLASFHVWVWPDMSRAYNSEVKQLVRRYLVSAHQLELRDAQHQVARYVRIWMPGRTGAEIDAARSAYAQHQQQRREKRRRGRKSA